METTKILDFLGELADNNNREWFAEHQPQYKEVKKEFEEITQRMINAIAAFDPTIKGLEPKECIFRIFRDARFSHDKTPYKRHLGTYICMRGGRKSIYGGYYLHIEKGASAIGGGIWMPESPILKKLRNAVHHNIDEFLSIIEAPGFKEHFTELCGERLKTVPKPFAKEAPHAELLKCKHYVVNKDVSDDFFLQPDWEAQCAEIFRTMKPFNDFLNYSLDEEL